MKSIKVRNCTISPIVTSSIMGHSGGGMFPLTLFPSYRRLMRVVEERRVVNLTKSSTYEKHNGNFRLLYPWTWKYIQRIGYNGLLNAYDLTNRGVKVHAEEIASAVKAGFNVIPSIYPQFAKGRELAIQEVIQAIMISNLSRSNLPRVVELNLSCPNSKEIIKENMADSLACVRAIRRQFPTTVIIGKISIVHPHEFAQELVYAGVDIIHAINAIPYDLAFPLRGRSGSPLADVGGGGVSGGPIFYQAFDYNTALRQKIDAPMIMGGGVFHLDCAKAYFDAGADAVSLCTVCRLNPAEAIRIIEEYA